MSDDKVTCSASPRAVVVLTGLIGLRKARPGEPSCALDDVGNAIWRLRHGIVVTCKLGEGGAAHWHLAHDDDSRPDSVVAERIHGEEGQR